MKKLLTVFACFFYIYITSNAQVSTEWGARVNGPGNNDDYGYFVQLDPMGNVYIVGYGLGPNGHTCIIVVKYNQAGVGLWSYFNDTSYVFKSTDSGVSWSQ